MTKDTVKANIILTSDYLQTSVREFGYAIDDILGNIDGADQEDNLEQLCDAFRFLSENYERIVDYMEKLIEINQGKDID